MTVSGIGADVEGYHAVAAALAAGRVERLFVEEARVSGYAEMIRRAEASGVAVRVVADVRSTAATTSPQGLVAVCRPIRPASIEEAVGASDPAAVLVLDHVEDPRNVGAIARSAVAAGVGGMILSTRRAAPLGATAFKAAAGAFEQLRLAPVSSIASAMEELRRSGVWMVGLDASSDRPLFGLDLLTEPVAVVVGAEGKGLGRLTAERCDVLVSIPMSSAVESLNASVAASLAAFEIARMRSRR